MTLAEKIRRLPEAPGCYLYRDSTGAIIYIGKAKNLRHRVRQYFHASRWRDVKTAELVAQIADLEYIVTDTEIEALILESHLIKQHQPRFNALLKDDKHYPHLKLTINEPFPRVLKVRRIERDGALYFGPYLPASLADQLLDLIQREFRLRPCSDEVFHTYRRKGRPCLQYQIKRCLGPCVEGLFGREPYWEAVRDVRMFLEGKNRDLAQSLRERMERAAEELRFEAAARYRDLLRVVERLSEEQKMALTTEVDADIFGLHTDGRRLALYLFTMRAGKIIGKRDFYWEALPPGDLGGFLAQVLVQYYAAGEYVPAEIVLPVPIEDRPLIEQWLSQKKGRRVRVYEPKRGMKRELVALAAQNAKLAFEEHFRVLRPEAPDVLQDVARALNLPRLPERIEAFDVSHLRGTEMVASLVVCEGGTMRKSEYRQYLVRTAREGDDYAALREVVHRRYARLLREARPLPDLVLIDGGRGQLRAAVEALEALNLGELPVAAIAKREEILYVKGWADPLILDRHSPALHLIQMIRDEAHRFAVTFHRRRRRQRDFASELLAIPGIGEKRKELLLRNFGSVSRIRRATIEELRPFVGERLARRIVEHFAASERPSEEEAGILEIGSPSG
ncbi:UvrABC system protein C [bacterium HR08]|nr:UvrABC system protein C [bacterium HR08]